jgi:hypothetical protein
MEGIGERSGWASEISCGSVRLLLLVHVFRVFIAVFGDILRRDDQSSWGKAGYMLFLKSREGG